MNLKEFYEAGEPLNQSMPGKKSVKSYMTVGNKAGRCTQMFKNLPQK